MPKIEVNVPHELEQAVAVERLKSFSNEFRSQFASQISSIEEEWFEEAMEFCIVARGLKISGNVAVQTDVIYVSSSLPFAALPFRGMIESSIRDAIDRALS